MKQKLYTIQVTNEQIKTIRTLYLRADLLYGHEQAVLVPSSDGTLEHRTLYRCFACHHGSYESFAAIIHDPKCLIPLMAKEWVALNQQFLTLEEGGAL
jgi:hypothetical protein